MNLRDTIKLKRINTMRSRYIAARLRALSADDCLCAFCVARRNNTDPVGALFKLLGVDEEADSKPSAKAH